MTEYDLVWVNKASTLKRRVATLQAQNRELKKKIKNMVDKDSVIDCFDFFAKNNNELGLYLNQDGKKFIKNLYKKEKGKCNEIRAK